MRIRLIALVVLFFLLSKINGQVNMQVGSAEQAFPLISYVDAKAGLTTGVGLAYSSGNGLLVNDIASDVGTGWNLDAGGVIIRIQNGEPDDQPENSTYKKSAGKNDASGISDVFKNYPNGYLYNPDIGKGCNVGLNYYPSFKQQSVYKELNVVASDMEQDKFMFRMNGRTGMFVIGRDWKVTTIGDSRVKVTLTTQNMTAQGIRTTINKFVIITEDGIKYTFQEKSLTRLCRYKYSSRNSNGTWVPINGNPDDGQYAVNRFWGYEMGLEERPFIVNSWFLSEMENTNTGQKVIYNYQDVSNNVIAGKMISHQRNLNESGPYCCNNNKDKQNGEYWYSLLSNPANASNYSWNTTLLNKLKAGTTSLVYNKSVIQSKRLSSITLPNGGTINFGYSSLQRVDLPGEHALETVTYTLSGKLIRSYKMSYGYFYMTAIRPYNTAFNSFESRFARLCLLSIQKTGTGEDNAYEPPYKFDYYTGSTHAMDDIVPARNFLSQDHWGYYNGSNSQLSLSEDHDFLSRERDEYFKTVLPKLKNPKNGYAKNGLLKSVTYPTGGKLEYYYSQNTPSQNILPAGNTPLAGGVSVLKTTLYDGEDHAKDIVKEYFYRNASNQNSRWGDEAPEYTSFSISEFNLKCFQGKSYKYPGLSYAEMATSIDWGKIIGKALVSAAVGMAVQYGIAQVLMAVGATAAIPFVNIAIFIASITKIIIDCTKTYKYHRFILANSNNMLQNPLPASYSAVEVRSNSPTGYNGKAIYEFTNLSDFSALVPRLAWPYTQVQRLASWAYGLPKKVTVFDKNNLKVNESSSFYNFITSKLNADNNNANCKCATINREAIRSKDWEDYDKTWFTWGTHRWMTPSPYFITTGRTDLAATSETYYTNGVSYASNQATIVTDPMTLLQKGKVVMRNQREIIFELTYFPTDFNIPGSALEKLVQINAVHTPVATETWLYKIGLNVPILNRMTMLNSTVTEYKTYTFGLRQEVKPWKTWQLKTKTPLPSLVIGTHNASQLLRNPAYYKLQSEFFYDNDGNLIQTNANDNVTSFVNDYNGRYVVASAANAAATDIAYTSFESTGKGGWTYNQSAVQTTSGLTGTKSFLVSSSNTITKSVADMGASYIITYWVKDDPGVQVLLNGWAGELQFQSNGWKLYKQEISETETITISGNGIIDELRFYPRGSLMSTVAYKEGIGKINECDANNRLLFYEYDALGRLQLVRDQNRNIIKTYEYNYKQ